MPAAVTYTFTNTEVADAAKINQNYDDLVDAINDYDGGTASASQRLAIPKAGTTVLNNLARKEAAIYYDTDEGKIKVDDGSNLKAVGGGLVPVPTDENHSTDLESGKHYMVDCESAGSDVVLNLQAGATEADIKITVYNIPSGKKVTVTPDGTEKIFYDDTDCDTVTFEYAETEQWIELCWNGTKWIVNDGSGVLSGTFNGSLAFTGFVTLPGGIRLIGYTTSSSTPSTSEITTSMDCAIHRNSSDGKIYLGFNYGGSIKSVELA